MSEKMMTCLWFDHGKATARRPNSMQPRSQQPRREDRRLTHGHAIGA